ncbi:MAG: division/cell wall cluster transcriptional repressor MraZ [Candidatus Dormibacteria bacterium]
MFLGFYRHTVDAKGRIAVPAAFRREFTQGSIVTIGAEGRLVIRPLAEWEQIQQQYRLTSDTPPDERRFIRYLFANARELELDAQGRLLLTPEQRQFASITDRAVFVGLGNVVELVGEETWEREMSDFGPEQFTSLNDTVQHHGETLHGGFVPPQT